MGQKLDQATLKSIVDKIASINFGSVTVIIQDGKVVQLETHEKTRFNS